MPLCPSTTFLLPDRNYTVVANTAARPVGGSLITGMTIYQVDLASTLLYDGTGWVVMSEPARTYTPTFSQTATITKTVQAARYQRSNGRCSGVITMTATSAGTNGGVIIVIPPVAPFLVGGGNLTFVGQGRIADASVGQYGVNVVAYPSGNSFAFLRNDTTFGNYFGVDPTMAIASGDLVDFSFDFEMASRYS